MATRDSSAPEFDAEDSLLPRLHLIEDQPLSDRADAYTQVHEELRLQLEGGDNVRSHG